MSDGSGGVDGDDFGVWATSAPPALGPPENDKDDHAVRSPTSVRPLDRAHRPSTYE
jgi:hypothetical protein